MDVSPRSPYGDNHTKKAIRHADVLLMEGRHDLIVIYKKA